MEKCSFNLAGPLMLLGIYFIMKYIEADNILDLMYGILVIIYSIRFKIIEVKQ